jgi:tetratricopeptide (TPR) repeat protein
MSEIFISYALPDRDYARRLANYLEAAGLSVWWDMSLEPGQVFREEIKRRIGEARHVIVLWSVTSVKSRWVLDEAGEAVDQGKLVPVSIGGCKPPLGFRQHHTPTVSDWQGDLAAVLPAVRGKAAPKPAKPPAKTAQDLLASGYAAYDSGDYARASADCNEAVRLKPDFADAYNNRGNAYYGKGDYARAIADYEQALRIDPNVKNVAANKARAERELAKSKK